LNADGSNEQVLHVGGQGTQAAYADIAWLDNQTALLLSPEGDQFSLYRLPLDSFDTAGLLAIASGPHGGVAPAEMEIIYAPGGQ
jgi:hypothetical protein